MSFNVSPTGYSKKHHDCWQDGEPVSVNMDEFYSGLDERLAAAETAGKCVVAELVEV
jgi:hypothetical protein